MIYFVSKEPSLFDLQDIKEMSVEESLNMISSWTYIQFDTETSGRDCHICKLLCMQFGSPDGNNQIIVDCSTIDPLLYKEVLESKYIVGQNLKFDLQFLYNYRIIPRKVYDTMIVEQLLYLGFPPAGKPGGISYSLAAIAKRYLDIDIDKTIRGEIIWRGLDYDVIKYAANDVKYLCPIMDLQIAECKRKGCLKGAQLECSVVPSVAYMEWCGILLDENKWKCKMLKDRESLEKAEKALNEFLVKTPKLSKFTKVDLQGDLWGGFDTTPKAIINWDSPKQVVEIFNLLGFDTKVVDKKTGENKDSVLEKVLIGQKGICDEFLDLYFKYKEYSKVCSTYGQGHLNMINPITGRIHTTFKQLGAASGRFSCGSTQPNTDLAKYKNIPQKECTYCNLQQLPSDEPTRSSFVAPKGSLFVSADFSAEEARLSGDIYQDEEVLNIFRKGLDSHSVYAKAFFSELKDIPVEDIKSKYHNLRQLAKGPEFALSFGGGANAIMQSIHCSKEKAEEIISNYENTFIGTALYAKKGSEKLMQTGYVDICKHTGHKMYWWDIENWKKEELSFTREFWEDYRNIHKPRQDEVYQKVRNHFKVKSKWERMVRNACTQGTGAIIMKESLTRLFDWIVENNLFSKVHICVCVHDEINCDYPKEIKNFPNILSTIMYESAAKYCKSIDIPVNVEVSDHWVH